MRVLIATAAVGSGHVQAAAALEEAWHGLRPKDAIKTVDLLAAAPHLYKKVYNDAYLKILEHAPELYALVFKKTDNPELVRKLTRLRRAFSRGANRAFAQELIAFQPDLVLCPHYFPLGILARRKTTSPASNPFTVCVVTDFEAHALWMDSAVDLYCVAADETKAGLLARAAPPEKVAVTGIPISGRFSEETDCKSVRKRLGIREDLRVLLVLGGGFGLGPVADALHELDKVRADIQIIVVTGKNAELRRELACQDRVHPTLILGFVSNMHELMAVAELILTKPGGLTSSEALALGRPLLILNPIPGQEAANSDFLLERGAAAKINRVEELSFRVEKLLQSQKINEMSRAARRLGRPTAARDICLEVLSRLGKPARS